MVEYSYNCLYVQYSYVCVYIYTYIIYYNYIHTCTHHALAIAQCVWYCLQLSIVVNPEFPMSSGLAKCLEMFDAKAK